MNRIKCLFVDLDKYFMWQSFSVSVVLMMMLFPDILPLF